MERYSNFLGGHPWMLFSSLQLCANSSPPIKADAAEPPPVPMLGKWLLLVAPCNWSWIVNDELRFIKSGMWRTYSQLRHWRCRAHRFQIPNTALHTSSPNAVKLRWSRTITGDVKVPRSLRSRFTAFTLTHCWLRSMDAWQAQFITRGDGIE